MEQDFTNREITEMFNDLRKGQDRIEAQTIKTNGRVTGLEKWKSFITGGISVITLILVPLLAWSLLEIINFKETLHVQVQAAVQDALSSYDVKVSQ